MQILLLLIFTTYFLTPFSVANVSGYGITPLDVVLIVFYLFIIKKLLWDGDKLRFSLNLSTIGLICLFAAAMLSSINPLTDGSPKLILQFFKTSIHFLFLVGFSIVACFYPIDSKKWTNVVRLWLILGLIINLFAVYQIVARAYDLPLAWIQYTNPSLFSRAEGIEQTDIQQLSLQYGDFFRATSIFSEPSALAGFNIYMIIFIFIPYLQNEKQFFSSKKFIGVCLGASIMAIFLTFSLTGAVGAGMIFAAGLVFEKISSFKTIIRIILITIAFIVLIDIGVSSYTNVSVLELFGRRLEGLLHYGTRDMEKDVTPGESVGVRMISGGNSIKIWQDYPVTGIGLGLTGYNKKYEIGFSDFSMLAALAEMGLIGFLSFNVMFLFLMFISLMFLKKRHRYIDFPPDLKRMMGIAFYLMILQFEINYVSGNNLVSIGLWIPVAMVFSTINSYYIKSGGKVHSISLVKAPLKELFAKAINRYNSLDR